MKTRNQNQEPDDSGLQAPPELVAALKAVPQEKLFIPPTVDEAVFHAAQKHFTRPERSRPLWAGWFRWALAGTAAAALCVLAAIWSGKLTRTSAPQFAVEDLNHDGKVDILDAFILAKRVEAGAEVPGDHTPMPSLDVRTLVAQAVKLDQSGRKLSPPLHSEGGRS